MDQTTWYYAIKALAVEIALEEGQVSADDLYERLPPPKGVKVAYGALFNARHWEMTGTIRSKRKSAKKRKVGVWKLKGV